MKEINDMNDEHVYMSDSLSGALAVDEVEACYDTHPPSATLKLMDDTSLTVLFKRVITYNAFGSPHLKLLAVVVDVNELKHLMSTTIMGIELRISDIDVLSEKTTGIAVEYDIVPINQNLIDLVISFKR